VTRKQDRIAQLLGEPEPVIDKSLRGQALRRAGERELPRTMTAWEWEAYYHEHGQPEAHSSVVKGARVRWPQRLRAWVRQRRLRETSIELGK
jgi:hypothetical protein